MRRQAFAQWLGALGGVVLLLVGCGSSDTAADGNGQDIVVSDEDSPTEDTAVETTPAPADEPAAVDEDAVAPRDPGEPISVESVYDPDTEPILAGFAPFAQGTYRTGALGTPMSFTTTEALNTQSNGDGIFVISDISSRAPDDRDLVFIRVGAFSDPTAPNAPIEEQTGWPNDDFRGWLENLNEGVIATDLVETTVNGLAAIRVDLELTDDIECGWLPGFCVGLVENNGHEIKALNKGASYRVWIIEQGGEDPLAIVDGIARAEDSPWYLRSDAVMDTIAFGDIAPNPAQWLVPGPNQLNVFGGVEVDLPDNLSELTNGRPRVVNRWNGRGFAQIPITDEPGAVFFSDRPHDLDGNPLGAADDVVAELTASGADLTERDATTIGGVDARVFDVATSDVGAIMLRFSPLDVKEDYLGWDAPAAGRIWLMDHPDRGLMMISAHAFENVDTMLPRVTELTEAVVDSMTFTS
jgi:hypothetical protein